MKKVIAFIIPLLIGGLGVLLLFYAPWVALVIAALLLTAGLKNFTIGNNPMGTPPMYNYGWVILELIESLICSIGLFIALFVICSYAWWVVLIALVLSILLHRRLGAFVVIVLTIIPLSMKD